MNDFKLKPIKGYAGIAAYNAYIGLMLNISLSTMAMDLIDDELSSNDVPDETFKRVKLLYKKFHALDDTHDLKKWVFMDLMKIADAQTSEFLLLLKIVTDENGIEISEINVNNYNAAELFEMLFAAFLACANHSQDVFF